MDLTQEDISDLSIYTAAKIARGLTDFVEWSNMMMRGVGEDVRPHLDEIWKNANALVEEHLDNFFKDPIESPRI